MRFRKQFKLRVSLFIIVTLWVHLIWVVESLEWVSPLQPVCQSLNKNCFQVAHPPLDYQTTVSSDDLLVGQGGGRVRVEGGDLHLPPDGVVDHRHMVRAVGDKYPSFRQLLYKATY